MLSQSWCLTTETVRTEPGSPWQMVDQCLSLGVGFEVLFSRSQRTRGSWSVVFGPSGKTSDLQRLVPPSNQLGGSEVLRCFYVNLPYFRCCD